MRTRTVIALLVGAVVLLAGCGPRATGEKGTEIVSATEAIELVESGAILVDVQNLLDYRKGHIEGAVNIGRADIVVNTPFANMLAPASQIEEVMSERGIGNDDLVVAYDDTNNMDAARLWWTLKIYGHDTVKVVSGGFEAMKRAGAEVTTDEPSVTATTFKAKPMREEMLAVKRELLDQVNTPDPNVVIVDTRTVEEYREGTVPGSVHLNYAGNNFTDGTYRPVRHIRIRYLEEGIDYDDTVILFCKTSIRAAQSYLALYNAGYRELKIYDGAWLEWSASPANPVQKVDPSVLQINPTDNS